MEQQRGNTALPSQPQGPEQHLKTQAKKPRNHHITDITSSSSCAPVFVDMPMQGKGTNQPLYSFEAGGTSQKVCGLIADTLLLQLGPQAGLN